MFYPRLLTKTKFKLKKNSVFFLGNSVLQVQKNYMRTFFTLLMTYSQGASYGYKITIYIRGKGLRLQLKTRKNVLCIYFKLGYSHKILLNLPRNTWAKIFGRRRTISLFSLDYMLLRNLALKIRSFYPMGLYKRRGFFLENEEIKIIEGKSRLGSGFGLYG